MINKGNCEKCHRKIQATLLDKCMFCGHALTGSQQFTDEEQNTIIVRQQHFKEINDIEREGNLNRNKRKGRDSYIDWTDFVD